MYKWIFVFFVIIVPASAFSQITVSGRVLSKADGKPVAGASVSINNSTIGTSTTMDGLFNLHAVKPGQYDLIISCLGYALYYQQLTVKDADINLPVIEMTEVTIQLNEVKIRPRDDNREIYLAMFTRAFLGATPNAVQCKILNPEVIDLQYSTADRILKASSDETIIIENKALGYRIHYHLLQFLKENSTRYQFYSGPAQFEEMKGSTGQQKQWIKNRQAVYFGSCMHFLRSVSAHQFAGEGFNVFKLIRKPNPDRPSDDFLHDKLVKFSPRSPHVAGWQDSARYYNAKYRLPKQVDYLSTTPLTEDQFTKPADNNLRGLQFPDLLYVVYKGSKAHPVMDTANPPSTVLIPNTSIALFDANGVFVDPASIVYDGTWGISGVADMLPIDYEPTVK